MFCKTNQQIINEMNQVEEMDQLKLWNKCNPELQINEKGEKICSSKTQY